MALQTISTTNATHWKATRRRQRRVWGSTPPRREDTDLSFGLAIRRHLPPPADGGAQPELLARQAVFYLSDVRHGFLHTGRPPSDHRHTVLPHRTRRFIG